MTFFLKSFAADNSLRVINGPGGAAFVVVFNTTKMLW